MAKMPALVLVHETAAPRSRQSRSRTHPAECADSANERADKQFTGCVHNKMVLAGCSVEIVQTRRVAGPAHR